MRKRPHNKGPLNFPQVRPQTWPCYGRVHDHVSNVIISFQATCCRLVVFTPATRSSLRRIDYAETRFTENIFGNNERPKHELILDEHPHQEPAQKQRVATDCGNVIEFSNVDVGL